MNNAEKLLNSLLEFTGAGSMGAVEMGVIPTLAPATVKIRGLRKRKKKKMVEDLVEGLLKEEKDEDDKDDCKYCKKCPSKKEFGKFCSEKCRAHDNLGFSLASQGADFLHDEEEE